MENTNLETVVEEEIVEETVYPTIAVAFTISDKKNVTMTKDTRDLLKGIIENSRETINLSEYELVGGYLTKQVAVCGSTGLPVRVSMKVSYTHNHPSALAKKGKKVVDPNAKSVTLYPAINL